MKTPYFLRVLLLYSVLSDTEKVMENHWKTRTFWALSDHRRISRRRREVLYPPNDTLRSPSAKTYQ